MNASIRNLYTRAWEDGAAECGVKPTELTQEERDRLEEEIWSELSHTGKFADAIVAGSKANGGKLGKLTGRIPMWVNRYQGVRYLAKIYACGDQKLMWVMNPVKEHCEDCLMLNGRIYRASLWKESGWEPRSRDLACRGYKCGCELVNTDLPATPGRPPRRI
jgi:hypothetical protein